MAMSRRKQLHPKSLKEEDEILFIVPNELKYDEQSNKIITQINLKQGHCFGPFPAILKIEDRIESFQLHDIKHNWLVYCSILNQSSSSENINLIFQNNQLFVIIKESISIGTYIYSNKIILPKLNMNNNNNKDIQIKTEPIENQIKKHNPLVFICETCGIRFSHRNTLHAHRQHYCMKKEIRKSHSTNSIITTGVKRKSIDNSLTIPEKRLSKDTYCSECDILFSKSDNLIQHKLYNCQTNSSSCKKLSFNRPIQIGEFIYVPIPVRSSQIDNKPLDLSKPKKINNEKKILQFKLYQCEFCSIRFRSLKTLHAHQDNYCIEYQKQKTSQNPSSSLFICRLCEHQENTLHGMHMHLKFHLSNNESCSDDDIIKKSNEFLFKCTICSAMFNNEEILLNHIKYVHTNETLIECLECRSRFSTNWNLIRHMKLLHTNIKYNEEDNNNNNDDEKSSDSMNLTQKILIKKFSCPFCHIKFGIIETLKQHMRNYCSSRPRIDEMKKKEKNITYCSTCQISFQHKNSYEAHKMYYCRDGKKTNVKIST